MPATPGRYIAAVAGCAVVNIITVVSDVAAPSAVAAVTSGSFVATGVCASHYHIANISFVVIDDRVVAMSATFRYV